MSTRHKLRRLSRQSVERKLSQRERLGLFCQRLHRGQVDLPAKIAAETFCAGQLCQIDSAGKEITARFIAIKVISPAISRS